MSISKKKRLNVLVLPLLFLIALVGASLYNTINPGVLTQENITISSVVGYNDTYFFNISSYVDIDNATFDFWSYDLYPTSPDVTTLNDSSTQTNITFTGGDNHIVWVNISKDADVTSITMTLEAFE